MYSYHACMTKYYRCVCMSTYCTIAYCTISGVWGLHYCNCIIHNFRSMLYTPVESLYCECMVISCLLLSCLHVGVPWVNVCLLYNFRCALGVYIAGQWMTRHSHRTYWKHCQKMIRTVCCVKPHSTLCVPTSMSRSIRMEKARQQLMQGVAKELQVVSTSYPLLTKFGSYCIYYILCQKEHLHQYSIKSEWSQIRLKIVCICMQYWLLEKVEIFHFFVLLNTSPTSYDTL